MYKQKYNTHTTPSINPNTLTPVMDKLTSQIFNLGNEFFEFKHVMEPFPSPIVITTPDTKIIYVNPAWEKLTKYSLKEVQNKDIALLQSKKTTKKIYKKLWETLLKGETFTTDQIIDQKKDGTEFQIHSTIFPINQNGKTLFYVQVMQDITNRIKLENLKKQFLHEAAHELKTPITALKLLIQLQIRKLVKDPHNPHILPNLQLINKDLDRLTKLIDELSDVTRIESGKLITDTQIVDITQIITDVITELQVIDKNHIISFPKTSKTFVIADPDRIKQVIINLLSNAIKYSNINTEIKVTTKKNKKNVTVYISDSGVGIPKSKLPYLFDRYYQVDKQHQVGLGLGLFIAKEIIMKHKGHIDVYSEEGKGSTFYFTLKRAVI